MLCLCHCPFSSRFGLCLGLMGCAVFGLFPSHDSSVLTTGLWLHCVPGKENRSKPSPEAARRVGSLFPVA